MVAFSKFLKVCCCLGVTTFLNGAIGGHLRGGKGASPDIKGTKETKGDEDVGDFLF